MKEILLYQDEPLNLDLNTIVNNLTNTCSFLRFKVGTSNPVIETPFLKKPESYQSLSGSIKKETENIFNAYIFSEKQYHNNYFFESYQNRVIISFDPAIAFSHSPMSVCVYFAIIGCHTAAFVGSKRISEYARLNSSTTP